MAFKIVTRGELSVCIWLHTVNDPPQEAWDRACAAMQEMKKKLGNDVARIRSLAISDGGAPNQTQRAQMFGAVFEKKPVKSAALTIVLDNKIKRGIATAIGWINPAFKIFPPEEVMAALEHVDLDKAILDDFVILQSTLGKPNETLARAIAKARQ